MQGPCWLDAPPKMSLGFSWKPTTRRQKDTCKMATRMMARSRVMATVRAAELRPLIAGCIRTECWDRLNLPHPCIPCRSGSGVLDSVLQLVDTTEYVCNLVGLLNIDQYVHCMLIIFIHELIIDRIVQQKHFYILIHVCVLPNLCEARAMATLFTYRNIAYRL